MKKLFLPGLILIGLLASCKTSSHTGCDAYGLHEQSDDSDIQANTIESNKKFVTSFTIK